MLKTDTWTLNVLWALQDPSFEVCPPGHPGGKRWAPSLGEEKALAHGSQGLGRSPQVQDGQHVRLPLSRVFLPHPPGFK